MVHGGRRDHALYPQRASGSTEAAASPQALWRVVTSLGGDVGYFYGGPLWTIREWIDGLLGGPGRTKGRRHPTELRVGDTIDYWTVLAIEPARRLTLNFDMKAPGHGVLEFEIEPIDAQRTRVSATAYWQPAGIGGRIYWWGLMPAPIRIPR